MDQLLFWWSWGATRLVCLSQLAITNITHSICQSATFIIPCVGGIKMLLLLLVFLPFRKVSCITVRDYCTDFIYPATKEHSSDEDFRMFRRQLFHNSLSAILQSLKPAMTIPEVVRYGDGHFRKTIYRLGPYIADYEEQVLLTCIVRRWCAR